MIDAPPSCYFCGSRLIAASLNFRKEVTGSDGGWRSMTDLLTVPVCENCLVWVETTARVAGSGKGHPRGLLGFPYAGSVKTLSDEHCNYCWAQLFAEAYAVDLIPTGRAAGHGGRQRHAGEMHAQRVCRYCYA